MPGGVGSKRGQSQGHDPSLSASQLANGSREVGEERTADIGHVLFSVGDDDL